MPDFRIFHVSDGIPVAESMITKFSGDRYNLTVDLYDLQRRSSSQTSLANMTKADISVLLVTPGMLKYLNTTTEDERPSFTTHLGAGSKPVAVGCFVAVEEIQKQVSIIFNNSDLTWRYLEVGETRESFNQCMISLISALEEEHVYMPIPKLKKCHILPNKPVLAGDVRFILLEDKLPENVDGSKLTLRLENGHEIIAHKFSECLYEFNVPASSQNSVAIEIFTNEGASLGTDEINYRNKAHLLSSLLLDLINPIEFMCQALQLDEISAEALDEKLASWFKFKVHVKTMSEAQRIMMGWIESISCESGSMLNSYQELPTLLHMSAKFNLYAVAENLLRHPWASMALGIRNKDGFTPEEIAANYNHQNLAQLFRSEIEFLQTASYDDEMYMTMSAEYSNPTELLFRGLRGPSHTILLDMAQDTSRKTRKQSQNSMSSIGEESNSLEKESSSLSPPPVFIQRKLAPTPVDKTTYGQTTLKSPEGGATESTPSNLLEQSAFSPLSNGIRVSAKTVVHHRYHSLDSDPPSTSSSGSPSTTDKLSSQQRATLDRSTSKSSRSSNESSGRPGTPPRLAQNLKLFMAQGRKKDPEQSQESQKKSKKKEISFANPLSRAYSVQNISAPSKSRRSSVTELVDDSRLTTSQSMTWLVEEIARKASQVKWVSPRFPERPSTLNLAPPPLPRKNSNKNVPVVSPSSKADATPLQLAAVKSPDHSQPINMYFEETVGSKSKIGCANHEGLDEAIYEDVDNLAKMNGNLHDNFLRNRTSRGRQSHRRRAILESALADETVKQAELDSKTSMQVSSTSSSTPSTASSMASSTASSSSTQSDETHVKSPSIFSALSSKLSFGKKQYRASRDHVTKM
ncbi:uncharacterized protein LOC131957215 [Physella acuta]|uniref:uncharacterized protein LOC131957215 n=1 Tax=Physella acuta TaxID=109671 RepID=UPI0027DBD95E|nr:uncharacterized protein LOC131957215 [Physella acuta]